jgi:hypothetical protein
MMANEADETPEDIVEHLAELGLHADDDLSDMLDDAPTTPDNPHGCCPGCMMSMHSPPTNPYGNKKGGAE